jgi:hypothetical protein
MSRPWYQVFSKSLFICCSIPKICYLYTSLILSCPGRTITIEVETRVSDQVELSRKQIDNEDGSPRGVMPEGALEPQEGAGGMNVDSLTGLHLCVKLLYYQFRKGFLT